jgi:glycosyltransferase involved in cell wall biosynthesis
MIIPEVSIIVPCYNQAQYLDECLHSVYDQIYENWECLIINDGSQDNTEEIAEKWIKKDTRFKYIFKENGGLSSARNFGLNNVSGDYVQFLDADDCLNPDKFTKSLLRIKDHSAQNIVVSHFKMFQDDIHDDLTSYGLLNQDALTYNEILFGWDFKFNIPVHCGFFSRSLFNDFRFPENLKAKEDWVMWLTFFQKNVTAFFIAEILAYYRNHNKSMTKDFDFMLINTIKALEYLDQVIPKNDYKSYLLYNIGKRMTDCENLTEKVNDLNKRMINSKTSIGYRTEKKVRNILKYFRITGK